LAWVRDGGAIDVHAVSQSLASTPVSRSDWPESSPSILTSTTPARAHLAYLEFAITQP
jgi:hypothetical protein